jgi:signal transduction histidine kinase
VEENYWNKGQAHRKIVGKRYIDRLNSTKDKFFRLAHDLKSPFSSLYSVSETLSGNYDALDEKDRRTGLVKIHKLAELIFKLLENLLMWSKSQRGGIVFTPVHFNLSTLVEVNINLHKIVAGEKGIILMNRVEGDYSAHGDREMTILFLNLINNINFTSGGAWQLKSEQRIPWKFCEIRSGYFTGER